MIVSRCWSLNNLRCAVKKNLLLQSKVNCVRQTVTRNKIYYRKIPSIEDITDNKGIIFFGAFTWWYVLWHLFTNYHVLLGYTYPNPSKWTDEELGIPED